MSASTHRLGIRIGQPDVKIAIEWKELLFSIGDAVIFGISAVPTAGATSPDAIASGLAALKSVRASEPVESRAYALVAFSFAKALQQLVPTDLVTTVNKRKVANDINMSIKSAIDQDDHYLNIDFFRNPTDFSLYKIARPALIDCLQSIRMDARFDSVLLGGKLDSAFAQAPYFVMRQNREYFSAIESTLSAPGLEIAQAELDWLAYRAHLIAKFNVEPIFGQEDTKVSLSQLYIPLHCLYNINSGTPSQPDADVEPDRASDMGTLIDRWLADGDVGDQVRLIVGGPGSGKSSFTKALAASLSHRDDRRPIVIELQRLSGLSDLKRAVERQLVSENEYFRTNPLEIKRESSPLVLIFDGLDELVVPGGEAATRIANDFASSLRYLLRDLNAPGVCRARAIVTGRTAIMQSFEQSIETAPAATFHVLGYSAFHARRSQEELKPDQRTLWWILYANAFGLAPTTPQALHSRALQELTNEPLLCYLLALSGYMTSDWQEAADNINRIYDRLLGDVWQRKWGRDSSGNVGRVGPALSLTRREDFDLLMETVAIAAWWGGESRIASKENFEKALLVTKAQAIWRKFCADGGNEITNLALTFYFRKADIEGQGLEFTHKTFSEYLVARYLLKLSHQRIAIPLKTHDIDFSEASDRWCQFAVFAQAGKGILPFIRNEARLFDKEQLQLMHLQLQAWMTEILQKGLPVHRSSSDISFQVLENRNRYGQANVLASLNSVVRALQAAGDQNVRIHLDWKGDRSGFAKMIRRLVDSEGSSAVESIAVSHIESAPEDGGGFCTSLFFPDGDLSYCDFTNFVLAKSYMRQTSFKGATFRGASMWDMDCELADFSGADLTRAKLDYSKLRQAVFEGSNMSGVQIFEADLTNAQLQRVNLSEASLRESIFKGADLYRADLTGASLINADLSGANLQYANLSKADLRGANLLRAKLKGAKLDEANLEGARFSKRATRG